MSTNASAANSYTAILGLLKLVDFWTVSTTRDDGINIVNIIYERLRLAPFKQLLKSPVSRSNIHGLNRGAVAENGPERESLAGHVAVAG